MHRWTYSKETLEGCGGRDPLRNGAVFEAQPPLDSAPAAGIPAHDPSFTPAPLFSAAEHKNTHNKRTASSIICLCLAVFLIGIFVSCDTGNNTPGPEQLAGTVAISGTVAVGQTLTADTSGTNASGTITYQWKRGETVVGDNQNTYAIVSADVGGTFTVTISSSGTTGNVTSAPTIAVPEQIQELAGTIVIDGQAKEGQTLTINESGLTNKNGTATYQWKRGETVIGSNANTYTVLAADVGGKIKATVSYSGNTGSVTSAETATIEQLIQELAGNVAINGTAKIGQTLTADESGLTNKSGTASYQWFRGTDEISGANGSTYVLTGADYGKVITLKISFSGNTGEKTSGATGAVAAIEIPFTMLGKTVTIEDRTGLVPGTLETKIKDAATAITDTPEKQDVLSRGEGVRLIIIESETNQWHNPTWNTVSASVSWLDSAGDTLIKNGLSARMQTEMYNAIASLKVQKSIFLANVNQKPQQMAAAVRNAFMDKMLAKDKVARQQSVLLTNAIWQRRGAWHQFSLV
jgi:hypothetical protein